MLITTNNNKSYLSRPNKQQLHLIARLRQRLALNALLAQIQDSYLRAKIKPIPLSAGFARRIFNYMSRDASYVCVYGVWKHGGRNIVDLVQQMKCYTMVIMEVDCIPMCQYVKEHPLKVITMQTHSTVPNNFICLLAP